MTTTRRIDAGPLLALTGATLLLISLFLDWFEPGLTAWEIFELVDLLLAAAAVATMLAALGMMADFPGAPDARILPWSSALPFLLVVATLLDRPPAVGDGDADVGVWLALAASALMAAGALLTSARVSIAFDVAARERRRAAEPTAPTAPMPPAPEDAKRP